MNTVQLRSFTPFMALLTLGFVTLSATGCNEQVQDALEREGAELRRNTEKQEAQFAPLVGRYEGFVRYAGTNDEKPVALILVPTTIIVQNPGRNDITQYPSLAGTLNAILPPFRQGEQETWVAVAYYDMASYDETESRLVLTGTIQNGSNAAVKVHLHGQVRSDFSINARISSSLKGEIGTVELKKTSDQVR